MPTRRDRPLLLGCLLSLLAAAAADAEPAARRGKVITFPAPAGVAPHEDYRVRVDGKEVFVYRSPAAAIAAFDFQGEVAVEVTTKWDVKWADVRPLSLGIKPRFKDSRVTFRMGAPANVSLELNMHVDATRPPLFIFAGAPEAAPPRPKQAGVRYFEGGKVHKAGIIELGSGETVYIAGGAVVQGAIRSRGGRDIKILGRGILDGTLHRELPERMRFVDLRDCARAHVEGIILSNSQTWQIVPSNCDGVVIRNVKIVSDNGGDDGIDVVRSRDVTIEGAFIRTKDDCIAVKSFVPGGPGVATTPPGDDVPGVKNLRVSKSVFWNAAWGNAIEIGFELRAGAVEDVLFEDSDIIRVEKGAALSIHNADRGAVRNVRFENIRVENADHKLFDVAIFLSRYSRDATDDEKTRRLMGAWDGVLPIDPARRAEHARHRGSVKGVLFKDISVVEGPFPFSIFHGYDAEHRVEDVRIQNLMVHGRRITDPAQARFTIENADVRFQE